MDQRRWLSSEHPGLCGNRQAIRGRLPPNLARASLSGEGSRRRARLTGDRRDPHRAARSDENRDQHLEDQSQRASWARWRENEGPRRRGGEGPGRRRGEELRRRCWEGDAWWRWRSKVEGRRSAGAECTGLCAKRAELLEPMLDARDKRQ